MDEDEEEYCKYCDVWFNPEEDDHDDCPYGDGHDFGNSSAVYCMDAELGTRFGN